MAVIELQEVTLAYDMHACD